MPRDEGIDVRKVAPKPAYTPPKMAAKPTRKQKDDEASNDPQPTQPTRYNPTGETQQPFTPPKWWNTLSNNVSNWIDNNVSGSQYVPAGLSQPQRPTTTAQFKPPVWGGNPMQVSEPFNPTLPTGTFFAGGSTQDGTRLVPTGQNTSLLLGGGGIRNQGTVRVARGLPMIGTPSQSSTTNSGGYGGTTYKKKGGSGGGYRGYNDYSGYSSDRVPSWLMSLTNWNFKA